MVTFAYNPPDLSLQDRRRVSAQDPGANVATTGAPVVVNTRNDMLVNLAGELAQLGKNFANQAFNIQTEKAYAEGAAEAGVTASEDELQSNMFTRDWKVAGYRDATTKYALADAEAQFEIDLVRGANLREKDPAELKAYLSERRNKLMPVISGMSGDQRTLAMAKLAMMDRASITKHLTAHQKFIFDYAARAQSASLKTQLDSLSLLKAKVVANGGIEDERAHRTQVESIVFGLEADVWQNPRMTVEEKQAMLSSSVDAALNTDNIDLYEYMDEQGLVGRLTPDDQVKVANKYREVRSRNEGIWAQKYTKQWAQMEADMDSNFYNGTVDSALAVLNAGLANKAETASTYETKAKKIYAWANKNGTDSRLVQAYSTGNATELTRLGKTEADAASAMNRSMVRQGMSVTQRMQAWLDAGSHWATGNTAYKEFGKLVAQPMGSLFAPGQEMLPEHKEALDSALTMVRDAESRGYTGLKNTMTSSMSDDDRLRFTRLYELTKAGRPVEGAVTEIQQIETYERSITPTQRAANTQKLNTELNGKVAELGGLGWLRSGALHVSALWNPADAARLQASPTNSMSTADGIFSTSETVRYYEANFQNAVKEEIANQRLIGYNTDADSIFSRSVSAVAGRTIKTDSGPLFLPRGFDSTTVLGTSGGNMEAVGPAIDSILKTTESASKEGTRYRLAFAEGKISAQAFDKNGAHMERLLITPDMIRTAMGLKAQSADARAKEVYGPGRTLEYDAGTTTNLAIGGAPIKQIGKLTFNGANNASIHDDWMMEFRENLIGGEGVRSKVYKDTRGIDTVGVGVMKDNPHYPKPDADGKVSPEAIRASFLGASNDAAKAGRKATEDTKLDGKDWFLLFSEVAYQSGTGWLEQNNDRGVAYRNFVAHAQAGNVGAAVDAFKKTPAYVHSKDPKSKKAGESARQAHYINLIKEAMKGQ